MAAAATTTTDTGARSPLQEEMRAREREHPFFRRYQLASGAQRNLGSGVHGRVYRASLRTDVANKLGAGTISDPHVLVVASKMMSQLRASGARNPRSRTAERQFQRECEALERLRHPNLVRFLERLEDSDGSVTYFVMEYVEHTLYELRPRFTQTRVRVLGSGVDHEQLRCLMRQVLRGLNYMHGQGYMHRDLKPQNILVSNAGHVKLADLGLARRHELATQPEQQYTFRMVSLNYRPPELLLGATRYGPEIDLWSVGVIIVEMACGHYVFGTSEDDAPTRDELPTQSELTYLDTIYAVCGTPPSTTHLHLKQPFWNVAHSRMRAVQQRQLIAHLHRLIPSGTVHHNSAMFALLDQQLLQYESHVRGSAMRALQSPWFWSTNVAPPACTHTEPSLYTHKPLQFPPTQVQRSATEKAAAQTKKPPTQMRTSRDT